MILLTQYIYMHDAKANPKNQPITIRQSLMHVTVSKELDAINAFRSRFHLVIEQIQNPKMPNQDISARRYVAPLCVRTFVYKENVAVMFKESKSTLPPRPSQTSSFHQGSRSSDGRLTCECRFVEPTHRLGRPIPPLSKQLSCPCEPSSSSVVRA